MSEEVKTVVCPDCQGRGLVSTTEECTRCKGVGKIAEGDVKKGEPVKTDAEVELPVPTPAPLHDEVQPAVNPNAGQPHGPVAPNATSVNQASQDSNLNKEPEDATEQSTSEPSNRTEPTGADDDASSQPASTAPEVPTEPVSEPADNASSDSDDAPSSKS